ncbi:MAG: hypothetical protein GF355_01095 [Candidatus Eisenbacteria bacterium]|nr:hypothetical protein [Candidatus Eisenbacteria bacterium]
MWDLAAGAVVAELSSGASIRARFSPDSRLLLVCDGPTPACRETGTWLVRYQVADTGLESGSRSPTFWPDGGLVALPGDYDVRLYNVETGERLATLSPPELVFVSAICFTPSNEELIALMQNRVLHVWDLLEIRDRLRAWGLDWRRSEAAGRAPAEPCDGSRTVRSHGNRRTEPVLCRPPGGLL